MSAPELENALNVAADGKVEPEQEIQLPTQAKISVFILRNNHEAEILLERTSTNTIDPTLGQLKEALAEAGVTTGIKMDVLGTLEHTPTYSERITIAVGRHPGLGKDGELAYKIEAQRSLRPAIGADGVADFKNLGYTNNVMAGQLLVEIIPPTQGEDGIDVLGNPLPGIWGKEPPSPKGDNTEISEDGKSLIATAYGDAVTSKGKVSVQEVLKIRGNIDNSTGSIHFPGDVMISGDVAAGFKITSGRNITVKGMVDAGHLEAAGDVVIGEGVSGMGRGTIEVGGSLRCRYMQNCLVRVAGDIFADTIMHANIECDGNLELVGKRGLLIGGYSGVAGRLSAKGIGSTSHVSTRIILNSISMSKQREREEIVSRIKQIDVDMGKLAQVLSRLEDLQKQNRIDVSQVKMIGQARMTYQGLSEERKTAVAEVENIDIIRLNSAQGSYAECKGKVYVGARFEFGSLNYIVQTDFVNSRVGVVDGEIKVTPL